MNDQDTTLEKLKQKIIAFRDARDWKKYNKIKDLAMSVVIEMGELMEHFHWRSEAYIKESLRDKKALDEIRYEFADVFIYLMTLAEGLKIDVTKAVNDKLVIQNKKYPVEEMKKWGKISEAEKWKNYEEIKKRYRKKG